MTPSGVEQTSGTLRLSEDARVNPTMTPSGVEQLVPGYSIPCNFE